MKKNETEKKLSLGKTTLSHLNDALMETIKGGTGGDAKAENGAATLRTRDYVICFTS